MEQRSARLWRIGWIRAGRRARTGRLAHSGAMRVLVEWQHLASPSRGTRMINDRQIVLSWNRDSDPTFLRSREWLVTNGLGGLPRAHWLAFPHANITDCSSQPGVTQGRHILISRCDECVTINDRQMHLGGAEYDSERFEGEVASVLEGIPAGPSHRRVDLRACRRGVREIHRDGAQPEHGVRAIHGCCKVRDSTAGAAVRFFSPS